MSLSFSSCEKNEEQLTNAEVLAEELKAVIASNGLTRVIHLPVGESWSSYGVDLGEGRS